MRARITYLILFVLALSFPFACQTTTPRTEGNVSPDSLVPKLATVDDVIQWSEKNLYFKNVDPWDPAPEVTDVIKDGYGDCKMLAGVVSVLLDSVGKKNLIIVIKSGNWHMFNAYDEDGKWRVVNNARLVERTFANLDEIKSYFKAIRFEKTFNSYKEFRRWFNEEIYPRGGR
ncbi:MAG: hypothetical protein ACUVQ9_13235 [Thermodesulfobacteriota bacterium]